MEYDCVSVSPTCSVVDSPHVYQFRIQLNEVDPQIWRLLQLPSDYGFFALHSAIQDAIGWTSNYAYCFQHFSRRPMSYFILSPLDGSLPSYEHDCLIKDHFKHEGDSASYVYHFDMPWQFQILFEKITPSVADAIYPKCVDGERGCPPENIGGNPVFQRHLRLAAEPESPLCQHSIRLLSSTGYSDDFNPEYVVFRNPKVLFRLLNGQ